MSALQLASSQQHLSAACLSIKQCQLQQYVQALA